MRIFSSIQDAFPNNGACVTIGNFDGVHLGHQSLIHRAREISKTRKLDFILVTFWPHPRMVLPNSPGHVPLANREQRMKLLAGEGVENILELPFTLELASLSAGDFIRNYLLPLNLRELVIGHDFTLGKGRQGNADCLRELSRKYNFNLEQIPALMLNGRPMSSTRLRECIQNGNVEEAIALLGRPHIICGKVTHGAGRGTGLGFPTANLDASDALLPANGVYATYVLWNGCRYPAVTNIGFNPTFGNKNLTVESYLLDCDLNLYGARLCLEFIARLRPEKTFASPDELVAQIDRDVAKARKLLLKEKPS